jgi:hypothetical protein
MTQQAADIPESRLASEGLCAPPLVCERHAGD